MAARIIVDVDSHAAESGNFGRKLVEAGVVLSGSSSGSVDDVGPVKRGGVDGTVPFALVGV